VWLWGRRRASWKRLFLRLDSSTQIDVSKTIVFCRNHGSCSSVLRLECQQNSSSGSCNPLISTRNSRIILVDGSCPLMRSRYEKSLHCCVFSGLPRPIIFIDDNYSWRMLMHGSMLQLIITHIEIAWPSSPMGRTMLASKHMTRM